MKGNPSRIRRSFRTPYFTEGWGLYAEQVMREQGFFTDPRQEMCQYEATLFRAARIIVDTSLHIGDMSFDEAVDFMHTRANLPEPTARAEVARYCAWPTQASAYLTGCLEILRIRERYLKERAAPCASSTIGWPPAAGCRSLWPSKPPSRPTVLVDAASFAVSAIFVLLVFWNATESVSPS